MTDFNSTSPIYLQIMNLVKERIVAGILKPGDKLPSVREQAEILAVNPNTVQRAYIELEREGVSETRRGTGTFIAERETLVSGLRTEMARTVTGNFIEGMRALGFTDEQLLSALDTELAGGTI
jgi:DNA-binding transcriptional regulator YhcF (GntR family)